MNRLDSCVKSLLVNTFEQFTTCGDLQSLSDHTAQHEFPSQEFIQIDERKLTDMLPASILDKVDRTRVTENFVIEKLTVQVIEVLCSEVTALFPT